DFSRDLPTIGVEPVYGIDQRAPDRNPPVASQPPRVDWCVIDDARKQFKGHRSLDSVQPCEGFVHKAGEVQGERALLLHQASAFQTFRISYPELGSRVL